NRKPLMRKTSAPESYIHLNLQSPFAERRNEGAKSPRRRAVCDELHSTRPPVGSSEMMSNGSCRDLVARAAGEGEGGVAEHR
ncbi:hypothetical protein PMAYCL1PPCAC_14071, partial [Pristionchus mayeri]